MCIVCFCMCVGLCICMYVHVCGYVYKCMCNICVYVYVCTLCICLCVYVYTSMYVCVFMEVKNWCQVSCSISLYLTLRQPLPEPEARWFRWDLFVCTQGCDYQCRSLWLAFYADTGDLKSGSHFTGWAISLTPVSYLLTIILCFAPISRWHWRQLWQWQPVTF